MIRLGPDEQKLWEGGPAWTYFLGHLLAGVVSLVVGLTLLLHGKFGWVGAVFALVALVPPAVAWIQRISVLYTVTSQRAVVERGLLSRHVWEIELANVRDIQLHQSIVQRLLRMGTLEISSAGRDTAEVVFRTIPHPDKVKEIIRSGMRSSVKAP